MPTDSIVKLDPGSAIIERDGPLCEAYHNDPCEAPSLNATCCKAYRDNALAGLIAAHPRLRQALPFPPSPPTPASLARMEFGTAVHSLVTGVGTVEVMPDDLSAKEAAQRRREAREAGAVCLADAMHAKATLLADTARGRLESLLGPNPTYEAAIYARDAEGGYLRARMDCLSETEHVIVDIKTTGMRLDERLGGAWSLQAAHYSDLYQRLTGEKAQVCFLALSTTYPGQSRLYVASDTYIEAAMTKREAARAALRAYLSGGIDWGELPSVELLPTYADLYDAGGEVAEAD